MRSDVRCGFLLVALLLVAGCGGSGKHGAAGLPGFLAQSSDGVAFLQWQRSNSSVTGTLSVSFYTADNPTQLQAKELSFTGTIEGSSVNLILNNGTTFTGQLHGSDITLGYTKSDGSIETLDFHPASSAEYNEAAANVSGRVNQASSAQAARQQVDSDPQTLGSDFSSLQSATSTVQGDTYASDLSSMNSDVQTAYNDLKATLNESDPLSTCGDSSSVDGDESSVEGDRSSVQGDTETFQYDMQTLAQGISTLQADEQAFTNDSQTAPDYQSSTTTPSALDVQSAIAAARAALATERRRILNANAYSVQLVSRARRYMSQADAACTRSGG